MWLELQGKDPSRKRFDPQSKCTSGERWKQEVLLVMIQVIGPGGLEGDAEK